MVVNKSEALRWITRQCYRFWQRQKGKAEWKRWDETATRTVWCTI